MNIGLRSILVPQTRFVVMVAISLVLLVSGTEEDLIPLDVLGVMVDFAVRLLGRNCRHGSFGKSAVRQHKCCFLCKQPVISIKPVPWKSRKNPCRICNFSHPPDQCPFRKAVAKESMAVCIGTPFCLS